MKNCLKEKGVSFPNVAGKIRGQRIAWSSGLVIYGSWMAFTRTVPVKPGEKSLTEMDSKKNGREGSGDSVWRQVCQIIIAENGSRETQ